MTGYYIAQKLNLNADIWKLLAVQSWTELLFFALVVLLAQFLTTLAVQWYLKKKRKFLMNIYDITLTPQEKYQRYQHFAVFLSPEMYELFLHNLFVKHGFYVFCIISAIVRYVI